MNTNEMVQRLVREGYIVLKVDEGIEEGVRDAAHQAVDEVGLVGMIDRMFQIIRNRQLQALAEDEMARKYADSGQISPEALAEIRDAAGVGDV